MNLKDYFEQKEGTGILATADSDGLVDAAIFSRPFVIDETEVAFIMADHLTRRNLLSNPNAAYLFIESGPGYEGKRLSLVLKVEVAGHDVEQDDLRGHFERARAQYPEEDLTVMYFRVGSTRPLVG